MGADVTIYCDGQWPKSPMYSKGCAEKFGRESGGLWSNYKYALDRARMAGWKTIEGRVMCPSCQQLLKQ